jgi:hypothetical protein
MQKGFNAEQIFTKFDTYSIEKIKKATVFMVSEKKRKKGLNLEPRFLKYLLTYLCGSTTKI